MATPIGRFVTEQPNREFIARYGLFSVVPPRDLPAVEAGAGGIAYQLSHDVGSHGYDVTCVTGDSKTFDAGPDTITADPITIYTSMTCGSVGMDADLAAEWIRERAESGEQPQIELLFSTGANGLAPGLNTAGTTLTAATSVTAAVSALEAWLYQTQLYGRRGILHVPAVAAAWLHANNAIRYDLDDHLWHTPQGTLVSIGAYAGNLPAATPGTPPAAGHTTLYITPEMAIYRDTEPNVFLAPYAQVFDKPGNQFIALLERNYIVSVDGPFAGVDTTLSA